MGRLPPGKTGSLASYLAFSERNYVALLGTSMEEFNAWRARWSGSDKYPGLGPAPAAPRAGRGQASASEEESDAQDRV